MRIVRRLLRSLSIRQGGDWHAIWSIVQRSSSDGGVAYRRFWPGGWCMNRIGPLTVNMTVNQ